MIYLVEEHLINLLGFNGQLLDVRHFLDQPFQLAEYCRDYRNCDPLSIDKIMNQQNNTRFKVPTQSVTSADGMASSTNHYDDLPPNPCASTSSDGAKREPEKFI